MPTLTQAPLAHAPVPVPPFDTDALTMQPRVGPLNTHGASTLPHTAHCLRFSTAAQFRSLRLNHFCRALHAMTFLNGHDLVHVGRYAATHELASPSPRSPHECHTPCLAESPSLQAAHVDSGCHLLAMIVESIPDSLATSSGGLFVY